MLLSVKELFVLNQLALRGDLLLRSDKASFPATWFKKDMTFSSQLDHWLVYFCRNKEFSETKP